MTTLHDQSGEMRHRNRFNQNSSIRFSLAQRDFFSSDEDYVIGHWRRIPPEQESFHLNG
jgi:hypothetical protein